MKTNLQALLFLVLFSIYSKAQLVKDESFDATIGFGVATNLVVNDDELSGATGLHLQADYVYELNSWFELRPYAGFLLTKPYQFEDRINTNTKINAFLGGGKIRLIAPIPWIAPYAEIGYGITIGELKSIDDYSLTPENNSFLFHVPLSFGLELGKKHNFNISISYFIMNNANLVSGALDVGLTIPLKKSKKKIEEEK